MGLLAPLYALAALGIIGPIVFHLIRRQPQGQLPFSSLMFLSPSPPRLTRRSRLDNILLLILRAVAIGLIALAFARPYLRQESFFNSTLAGRNIVVLLDTSASMQREDVWKAATDELRKLLDSLSPADRISLYTVDENVTPVVPFVRDAGTTSATTIDSVRAAIEKLEPTWSRTELAKGLRTTADMLSSASIEGQIDGTAENEIVLISDLHVESELESLQGYPWPEAIGLDVRQIVPSIPGNARASLMVSDEEGPRESMEEKPKVRIENNPGSLSQTIQLSWGGPSGPIANSATTVQVPAGQVRVVPIVNRPNGATYIELMGDAWAGDNRVFVPQVETVVQQIAYVGSQSAEQEGSLGYFLKQAPLDTPLVRREVTTSSLQTLDLNDKSTKVVVVELDSGSQPLAGELREFARGGGTVLVCLANPATLVDSRNAFLEQLCDTSEILVREAKVKDYALISRIDYTHPVFAPFADPRFNDFSKIRFWNHRVLSIPYENSSLRIIAHFDDKSPMLIENSVGDGRVWVLAAGWQPNSSTLALSSKFVPILMGILDPSGRLRKSVSSYEVGEPIDLSDLLIDSELQDTDLPLVVMRADGSEADSSVAVIRDSELRLLEPGLFTLRSGEGSRQIAVQVPSAESQHQPLDSDVFLQYGISLGKVAADVERRDKTRQLQIEELEGKQRLWQWLIAAGLAVLAVETWLAGRLAHRNAKLLSAA